MKRNRKAAPRLTLLAPSVDEAPNGVLDPANLPADGATVRIKPYDNMAYLDHVYLSVGDYADDIRISQSAAGKDVAFAVPAQVFSESADNPILLSYEVQPYQGERVSSQPLELALGGGFEGEVNVDLSAENYIVSSIKPPLVTPAFARMSFDATWGVSPYAYSSSDLTIASVNATTGEVTANLNGSCQITAVDAGGESRSYTLIIKGIKHLHFLSGSADWDGLQRTCQAANLSPVSLAQIRRFWTLYYPSSGAVASYLGWLNYPVWTGDVLGADTAWAYDLNGSQVNENASSYSADTFLPAVGISLG
ncbi:hypothetical protein QN382_20735 [Pseudomonas sp. 10B1]|uniref:hypothetical protein n=1 Tax=unclassified Pseudomonas TaxID=196821 RepID=UPI002AB387D4|nr:MULTISPECIES: hypothetical protein [unclassified Pseudomonas]MDY7561180.1 hypothetical protein [Pseudomonas sp. AB6]MEA9978562.1 hypothetical protein [Pseudomonas sp. RTS4]MEA9994247.1 hypothetical protein [Pseudomonas sp. AA4]MEB0089490.1 hypothetical protein [Pseudomonas sp. RTI1]MEB0126501.1 hypothetical protein [Pseudomonas sp. CCC1.2]